MENEGGETEKYVLKDPMFIYDDLTSDLYMFWGKH